MMYPVEKFMNDKYLQRKYIHKSSAPNTKTKTKIYNNANIITFDIETTSIMYNGKKYAFPYIWMVNINGISLYSRNWKLFKEFIDECVNDKRNINVIYVHYLSFEFQFLRNILEFKKVFARTDRKPIFCTYKNIEFRCSYFLSQRSLENVAKDYKIDVEKQVGKLNYSLCRTPKTPLDADEMYYCECDVVILYEYIKIMLSQNNYKYSQIPYTQTGFVRRALLEKVCEEKEYHKIRNIVKRCYPNSEVFAMLNNAYAGGYVHANFISVLMGIIDNVHSYDLSSSYPAVICRKKFPMGRFKKIIQNKKNYVNNPKFAWVANVKLQGVHHKCEMSFISQSKCTHVENPIINNGRIFSADEITITLTDVDYHVINQMYDIDKTFIGDMYVSEYDYLPRSIVLAVLDLYYDKTALKDVEESYSVYMVKKQMANAVYGCCVMNPASAFCEYDCDNNVWCEDTKNIDVQSALDKYYSNDKTIILYQWGVWITAHARAVLCAQILQIGDKCHYSDTDSIKCSGDVHDLFERANEIIHAENVQASEHFGIDIKMYMPCDINGKCHELGTWDFEGTAEKFKTLGCKRYATIKNGVYHATVAGCPKKSMEKKLEQIGLEHFNIHLQLSGKYDEDGNNESGKNTMLYIDVDTPFDAIITDYNGKKCVVTIGHGIHAEGAPFAMKRNGVYTEFLEMFATSDIMPATV